MKTSVYFSGIACSIIMLAGCMFKVMHWPGANVMIITSSFLFCFLFLPMALMNSYKNQVDSKLKTLHFIAYFVFALCIMSVLFKIMHWPGAAIGVLIGLPLPFVVFLPAYLYYTKDEKKEGNSNFLGMMFGLTFLAIFSVLLALTISRQVLGSAITKVDTNESSSAFSASVANSLNTNEAVKKSSDELCAYVEDLKCQLLIATDNDYLITNNKMRTGPDLRTMDQVDNKNTPIKTLIGFEVNKLDELKTKIESYHKGLLANGKMNPELTDLCAILFNVENTMDPRTTDQSIFLTWEDREFANKQLIFVLDGLTEIQSNVRLVETEVLLASK